MSFIKESLEYVKKNLLEANEVEVIIPQDKLMDPQSVSLKGIAAQKKAEVDAAEEAEKKEQELQAAREKGEELFNKITNKSDIESWFDVLVPVSGKAETVAGEAVRAMMRILYRDFNDGDVFYEGYGLETVAPSMCYLMDMEFVDVDTVSDIIDRHLTGSDYTAAIKEISDNLIDFLTEHVELLGTPNEDNSRDWDAEYLEEMQPVYDYTITFSDRVNQALENGEIDTQDIVRYVEDVLSWDSTLSDAEVPYAPSRHDGGIEVTELTRDALDTLEDWFTSYRDGRKLLDWDKVDSFWVDLVGDDDISDIDEDGTDDFDETEDLDEGLQEGLSNMQKIANYLESQGYSLDIEK